MIKKRNEGIPIKWLFISIIVCLFIFVSVFSTITPIINHFPLYVNQERGSLARDYPLHITLPHFIKEYGFSKVPNWYNGYYPWLYYPVGYHSLFFPLFLLLDNALLTVFLSIIILYAISIIGFLLFGKLNKINRKKSLIFFILFHFNYLTLVLVTIRIGRMAEFTGWTTFIFMASIIFYYKEKQIKWPFIILCGLTNIILLFSHFMIFLIGNVLLLSLFLVKNKKEKIFIIGSWLLTSLLTLPWWLNYLLNYNNIGVSLTEYGSLQQFFIFILANPARKLVGILLQDAFVILFILLFYIYLKSIETKRRKKELLFFSIPILLAVLYFSKLIYLVPFFSKIYYYSYVQFFLFLLLYLLFKLDITKISRRASFLLKWFLQIIPVLMFIYFIIFIHSFEGFPNHEIDQAQIELIKHVEGKVIIINTPKFYINHNVVSYAALYYNISSPNGYTPHASPKEILIKLDSARKYLEESNCDKFEEELRKLKTTEVITYEDRCDTLDKCGFELKKNTKHGCLFKIKDIQKAKHEKAVTRTQEK